MQETVQNTSSQLTNSNLKSVLLTTQLELEKLGVGINLTELWSSLDAEISEFQNQVDRKKTNLNYAINFEHLFNCIETTDKFIKDKISNIYKQYENGISLTTKINLTESKKKKMIRKKRYEPEWNEYCTRYKKLENHFLNELKPKEEKLFQLRKKYAQKVMINYQRNINILLKKLDAGFSLINFSVPKNRRENLELFAIKFDNFSSKIPLDGFQYEPNFKNTLSDSDKRLLAFSFFIVELQNLDDLSEHIIILDDPMSSFDTERKLSTIKVLRDNLNDQNGNRSKQLIILTHEDNFYIFLDKLFTSSKQFLRIKTDTISKSSIIQKCDIYEEFIKDAHLKQLDALFKYSNGYIEDCNLSSIRTVMEHIIKRKYYLRMPSTIVHNGGIIGWYKKEVGNDSLRQKIDDIFPHSSHHDEIGFSVGIEEMSDGDRKNLVANFLEIIDFI